MAIIIHVSVINVILEYVTIFIVHLTPDLEVDVDPYIFWEKINRYRLFF